MALGGLMPYHTVQYKSGCQGRAEGCVPVALRFTPTHVFQFCVTLLVLLDCRLTLVYTVELLLIACGIAFHTHAVMRKRPLRQATPGAMP